MFTVNRKGKSTLQWDKVVDSGTRTAFGTGSQRDTQAGKGRYDLIPTSMLHRLAQHYENGSLKYGDNNWQKGQPLHQYYNSAMRHLQAIHDADLSEDHFAAAIWNIAAMLHHVDAMLAGTLPTSLDSFGIVEKVIQHEKSDYEREMEGLRDYQYPVPYQSTTRWNPVVASGVMPDDNPFLSEAYDKNRFIAGLGVRRFKTTDTPDDL